MNADPIVKSMAKSVSIYKKTKDTHEADNNIFSTKANTLLSLKSLLKKSVIEEIYVLSVQRFMEDPQRIACEVNTVFHGETIIVRSSSKQEDLACESLAGHFLSIQNIDSNDEQAIKHAISMVIASYDDAVRSDEQVLIQRQTENVICSGVIFTRDPQGNRPYYVINYDESDKTNYVTSGAGGHIVYLSRSIPHDAVPLKWKTLMDAVWELESIMMECQLDIEFAITQSEIVIFQVRPLFVTCKNKKQASDESIKATRGIIRKEYQKLATAGLTCFSDMAFWNPAEIIGTNPKNLEYSLYREIITKEAWNAGLLPLGYRRVCRELMYRFGNKPYVSVESVFESLVPNSISERLALKLQKYYLGKLKGDHTAHDKIEFDISHNCFDFSTHNRLAGLLADGFCNDDVLELENALKELTITVIKTYAEVIERDKRDLNHLEQIRQNIIKRTKDCDSPIILASSIHILLDAIAQFGTPQFSRHARCAFIAKALCKSLVAENYINSEHINQFMSRIKTVATEFDRDYCSVIDGQMNLNEFFSVYGHLRAGTYDITSPRYDQLEKLFTHPLSCESREEIEIDFYDDALIKAIEAAIMDYVPESLNSGEVLFFISNSIAQREYLKFIFTKSLSFAIELIKWLGSTVGIEASNMSHLEISEIYAAENYNDCGELFRYWMKKIQKSCKYYNTCTRIVLPSVIDSERDFDVIKCIGARPNFITLNSVTGAVIELNGKSTEPLAGKIIAIEKADPGYDWIFTQNIGGLITKYGGPASHMAIRCSEFNIPAALGCGRIIYEFIAGSKLISLDCKRGIIKRVE